MKIIYAKMFIILLVKYSSAVYVSVNHYSYAKGIQLCIRPNPCPQGAYNVTGKTTVCVTCSFMEIKTKSYKSKKRRTDFILRGWSRMGVGKRKVSWKR